MTSFGNCVRERRQERGISLVEVAERLGVSKSYVSMLENGRRSPSVEHFEALSQILDIPADVLRVSAGCLPPDVLTAVPERAASIISAIRREDEGARLNFPSQLPTDFQAEAVASAGRGKARVVAPFTDSLRVGKNSTTYRAHSYHTKVPPEAIERLVRHYTREGQLIADPFCGSGMAGVAAIGCGRMAVLSDLSPAAVHIARNYSTPCDPKQFLASVARVAEKVRPMIAWLYDVGTPASGHRVEYTVWSDIFECPHCTAAIVYWDGAKDPRTGSLTGTVACSKCRRASDKRALRWIGEKPVETNSKSATGRATHHPTSAEFELINRANSQETLHWIPDVGFARDREMWRAGHAAAGIRSVADFYTRRNLHALAAIRHAIQEERDERLRAALFFTFTASVNRASKRYQWNDKRPTNVMTGTLYVSSLRYEWNVWSLFQRKAGDVARYYEHLGSPSGRAAVVLASATSLGHLPDASVDYVFMDPPFGSNIFYADSSLLWEAWLGVLTEDADEIVVNKHRAATGGKSLSDYQRLMTQSFHEAARILKPDAYATLQFNNTNDEVWCAIQDALSDAGLEVRHAVGLDKIHPSIKGVKGRQAREDIAALDTLMQLRRGRRRSRSQSESATSAEVRDVLRQYASTLGRSFTTDEAFSHLVRLTLTRGASLAGISTVAVKSLCADLFTPAGARWTTGDAAPRSFRGVKPMTGCFITRYLTPDSELRLLTEEVREAPDVSGESPRVVSGQRNTALYNAHSYHTKVPPEAIVPFLRHFTRPGDVVLDPFCGSGMTGVAALLTGRRAMLSDLSVAAIHLAYNHTRPCDATDLTAAFEEVARDLRDEFTDIYACGDGRERGYLHYTLWSRDATCPECDRSFSLWDTINRDTGRMPTSVRCPHCRRNSPKHSLRYKGNRPVLLSYVRRNGTRVEREPSPKDIALMERFSRDKVQAWYPNVPVESSREMYIRSALHLQGIETVADFYTPRNLHALALLWQRIQRVGDERLKSALAFAFTNTAWHGTRMRRFNARGGQRPLTGTLYIPQISSEANVLEVMRNKIRQLRSYYDALGHGEGALPAIRLGSATRLAGIPDKSIDYVFTDPPFGSNIFYADCNLIWEAWLGGLTVDAEEAVVNRSRSAARGGKTIEDYQRLMTASMVEMNRVLKHGAFATLVFHNTDPAIWQALQRAAEDANLHIEDAGSLNRKQQSHKGYKGRSEEEDVAHFDVIMSMRKPSTKPARRRRVELQDIQAFILEAYRSLSPHDRTLQRVHSEVIQQLARKGLDLGAVSFETVRQLMPARLVSGKAQHQIPFDS